MKFNKITAVIVATLMTFAVLAFSSSAAAPLDQKGSITLHVTSSSTGKPLVGATFRLYHMADAYEQGLGVRYEMIPPYDKANISIDNLQDAYLPIHLTSFSMTYAVPYTEKSADETGEIVFDNLTPGLYLIVPSGNFEGYYMPAPFVINIPKYDSGNRIWEFDVIATPKMIIIDGNANTQSTYISVQKKWETDGRHPDSVTVVLLRDLEEFARVELNESNNWYYRWDSLPKNYVWNVVEDKVPDGFEVIYESSSNTVTIINKAVEPEETTTSAVTETKPVTPPGETIPGETVPGSTVPGVTVPGQTLPGETTLPGGQDGTTVPGDSDKETTTKPDELIDTGQLNWPVPVFAVVGLLVFSIGWAMLNFGKKETE